MNVIDAPKLPDAAVFYWPKILPNFSFQAPKIARAGGNAGTKRMLYWVASVNEDMFPERQNRLY